MISTTAKAKRDRYNYYGGYGQTKDYDALAAEYVDERELKIAKEKSAKMSPKDKEVAKDLKKVAEGEDGEEKNEGDEEKKEGEEKKRRRRRIRKEGREAKSIKSSSQKV